jgi:hypothetical protein
MLEMKHTRGPHDSISIDLNSVLLCCDNANKILRFR